MSAMSTRTWHIPDPHDQQEFYADVPMKRLLAWLVDTVLTLLLVVLLVLLTAFTALLIVVPLYLAVSLAYRTVTLANGSATLGMRLFAIEFRTLDGTRLDGSQAFLHSLGYSISCSLPVLQFASIVMMLSTARGQGLTDMIMGTVALNRKAHP